MLLKIKIRSYLVVLFNNLQFYIHLNKLKLYQNLVQKVGYFLLKILKKNKYKKKDLIYLKKTNMI